MTYSHPSSLAFEQLHSVISGHKLDIVTEIAHADGSEQLIEELRIQLIEHDAAARQRHDALTAELTRQREIRATLEAERVYSEQLAAATVDYENLSSRYYDLASLANAACTELYAVSCQAAVNFRTAVRAEQARRDALPALAAAYQRLRELEPSAAAPSTGEQHDFHFDAHDFRNGVAATGLNVFPHLRRELAQLADSGTSPVQEPAASRSSDVDTPANDLDAIAARSQAKRLHDSSMRDQLAIQA